MAAAAPVLPVPTAYKPSSIVAPTPPGILDKSVAVATITYFIK